MSTIRSEYGVPEEMKSCHTAIVEGYVVEGHVPVEQINQLLRDKPDIAGYALPGMPPGSPGMTGEADGPFDVQPIPKK